MYISADTSSNISELEQVFLRIIFCVFGASIKCSCINMRNMLNTGLKNDSSGVKR